MINHDRLIQLTQKVISIDSQNPPGREEELARFIQKDMQSLLSGVSSEKPFEIDDVAIHMVRIIHCHF